MSQEIISAAIQAEIEGILESLAGQGEITRIDTVAQFEAANKMLQEVKEKKKYVRELYENSSAPHKTALYTIRDYFRQYIGFDAKNPDGQLDRIEAKLKAPMITFQRQEEQKRIEDQRKADEDARKQREAAEAEARKKREAEEAQRREADRKRREAEEAELRAQKAKEEQVAAEKRAAEAKTKAAREKAEKEAREAQERARVEAEAKAQAEKDALKADKQADKSAAAADQAIECATTVVPQVVQSVAKVKGFSVAKTYKAEIEDPEAFMMWCLQQGKLHYLTIDMKVVNKIVKAEGPNFKAHGIRVVEDFSARSQAA